DPCQPPGYPQDGGEHGYPQRTTHQDVQSPHERQGGAHQDAREGSCEEGSDPEGACKKGAGEEGTWPVRYATRRDGPGRQDRHQCADRRVEARGKRGQGGLEKACRQEGGGKKGGIEEGRTEEGRTEEGRTEEGRTEEGRTEEGRTEEGRTEEGRTEENRSQ